MHKESDSEYVKFIRNVTNNGISVDKIVETPEFIGVELTQFRHPSIDIIDEIIRNASDDAGFKKEVKKDLRIANLKAKTDFNEDFERNSQLIYERKTNRTFNTSTNLSLRPFLASREEFFKGALMLENNLSLIHI